MKKLNIPLLISLIIGVCYLLYSISYWTGANGSGSDTAELGAALATVMVAPHLVLTGVAVVFPLHQEAGVCSGCRHSVCSRDGVLHHVLHVCDRGDDSFFRRVCPAQEAASVAVVLLRGRARDVNGATGFLFCSDDCTAEFSDVTLDTPRLNN